MSENERRTAVVDQATSWLGRNEQDGSHAEILRVYNAIRPLPRGHALGLDEPFDRMGSMTRFTRGSLSLSMRMSMCVSRR